MTSAGAAASGPTAWLGPSVIPPKIKDITY